MLNFVLCAILFVLFCYGIAGHLKGWEAAAVIVICLAYRAFTTYLW